MRPPPWALLFSFLHSALHSSILYIYLSKPLFACVMYETRLATARQHSCLPPPFPILSLRVVPARVVFAFSTTKGHCPATVFIYLPDWLTGPSAPAHCLDLHTIHERNWGENGEWRIFCDRRRCWPPRVSDSAGDGLRNPPEGPS